MAQPGASLLILVLSSIMATLTATAAAADGAVLITQSSALAGNITPGDTPGFPITISREGTYRLATSLRVTGGTSAIIVTGPDVVIDLDGFTIHGNATGNVGIASSDSNAISVTIRNGTITGFVGDGINARGDFWIVENMRVLRNSGNGIKIGDNFRAHHNIISQNKKMGLQCNYACHVEGNVIAQNGDIGLYITTGTALGNTILSNTSYGFYGFYAAFGNNTLILNNHDQSGPQVLGAVYPLDPNFCNPAC